MNRGGRQRGLDRAAGVGEGGRGPKMRISLLGRPCGQPASPVEARKEGKKAGTLLQFALGELWLDVKG